MKTKRKIIEYLPIVIGIIPIIVISYALQKEYSLFNIAYNIIMENVWMQWIAILLLGLGILVPLFSLFAVGIIKLLNFVTKKKKESFSGANKED